MAKISTYPNDSNLTINDKLIGTDFEDDNITKNFTVGALSNLILSNIQATLVLNAKSTVDQEPSGVGVALKVNFGPAQGGPSTPVEIDALGNVTFNQSGLYIINGFGSIERRGSSGGTSILAFRGLLNGNQVLSTKAFHITNVGTAIPYEITVPFQVNAGDTFYFEIMRDASGSGGGQNQGGLYIDTLLSGWSNVPSAELLIWKIN